MPPATSATEGLRELRWPRSVGPSTYLAPTSTAHPTIAHPNSSQQRRVRPGLPTPSTSGRHHRFTTQEPDAQVLYTSCADGPGSPRGFYLRYGFTDTGREMSGENVLALDLAAQD